MKAKLEQCSRERVPRALSDGFIRWELGPPVGWPLQYRVSGPDPDQVRAIAFKVADALGSDPGARNINYNSMDPSANGPDSGRPGPGPAPGCLSSEQLALSLNAVLSGVTGPPRCAAESTSSMCWSGATAAQRMSLATIRTLQGPATAHERAYGSAQPDRLLSITLRNTRSFGVGDRRPTVTVQADLAPRNSGGNCGPDRGAEDHSAECGVYRAGYDIGVGGTVEESNKAADIGHCRGAALMMIITLTVLMLQLQSFNADVVASAKCLLSIGPDVALLPRCSISDKPLGFVAFARGPLG